MQPILTTDHAAETGHIEEAIDWYAGNRLICPRPVVPNLRRMFGLTAAQAVQAMRLGNLRADAWQHQGGGA